MHALSALVRQEVHAGIVRVLPAFIRREVRAGLGLDPASSRSSKRRVSTPIVCPECREWFQLPRALGSHRKYMHGITREDAARKGPFAPTAGGRK